MNKNHPIAPGGLLKRAAQTIPTQRPPAFFTERTMQLVRREALRKEQRQERFYVAGLIVGSTVLLLLAVAALLLFASLQPTLPSVTSISPIYISLTFVVVIMFFVETQLRRRWKKRG